MARRVTWTNNSTSYDGTNIYRDTTIDPMNLPEPIATVDPMAQGATVEYIDLTGVGDQCYAVRDFDSSGDGALSEAYCFDTDPFADAQVGDEIEGGVYAGTITYADAREFHIIFAKQSGESGSLDWKDSATSTSGTTDDDDGRANTDAMITAGIEAHPAASHCVNYSSDGFGDFYLPAPNELALVDSLVSMSHPEFSADLSTYRWASKEFNDGFAYARRFSDGDETFPSKVDSPEPFVRPVRRVAV